MRFPLIPSIIVAGAIATMIALGIWQLGRADEKEALLASYAAAQDNPDPVAFPGRGEEAEQALYRRASVDCATVRAIETRGATSASGAKGWAHYAECTLADGSEAEVALGFSRDPQAIAWDGGEATGIIGPGPKLVADPALAGLDPLAKPDPADIPNNHLAYAGQWFFFALTALVIFVLAVRRKSRGL